MTSEDILKRKRILRENGYNVSLDASWGPNLDKMWADLSSKILVGGANYHVGDPIKVLPRHDELRPGKDDAKSAEILKDGEEKAKKALEDLNKFSIWHPFATDVEKKERAEKKAERVLSESYEKFDEKQDPSDYGSTFNPLTWGGMWAVNTVNKVPLSERANYLLSHPRINALYNDALRYREGKALGNGVEALAKTAALAGVASSIPTIIGADATAAGVAAGSTGARVVSLGVNAASRALGTLWKLAKAMPWRYGLNAVKDFLVVPTIAGGAVNYVTKAATDWGTGGYGTTFDEGVSAGLGVPEFVGSTLNPGYNFRVFQPDWKKLWRAGNIDRNYLYNLKEASRPGLNLKRRTEIVKSVPISRMRDAAKATLKDLKQRPDLPVRVMLLGDIYVPSHTTVSSNVVAVSPFNKLHSTSFCIRGTLGTIYKSGRHVVDANGVLYDLHDAAWPNTEGVVYVRGLPIARGSYDAITGDYAKFAKGVSEAVGDDGLLSGSVLQFADGWFPGSFDGLGFNPAHDMEFLTTEARLPALKEKLGIGDLSSPRDFVRSGKSSKFPLLSNGETDIQLILEKNGKATGKAAHEVYAYLHPEEYAKMHDQYTVANSTKTPDIKWEDTELPISAELLYSELRNSGENGLRVLMDVFSSLKDKHVNRAKTLIANPEKLHAMLPAYLRLISSIIEGYLDPVSIYKNFDFNNIESNKLFILYVLGLPEEETAKLANNREYVKDLFRMFINNKSISFRRTSIPENGDVITGLTHGAAGYGRGLASGPGLNMTRVAPIGNNDYYGEYVGVLLNPLTYHPEKITNTQELLLLLAHLGSDVPELYKQGDDIASEALRISKLALEKDMPVYLTPGHNYNGTYLGMLHDLKVPYGVYANPENVEVPGGAVIESVRHGTIGGNETREMTLELFVQYLKELRQNAIEKAMGNMEGMPSYKLSNAEYTFPTNLGAAGTGGMYLIIRNMEMDPFTSDLVRSAKVLRGVSDPMALYQKASSIKGLANMSDSEVTLLDHLMNVLIRNQVNVPRDEARKLYLQWLNRQNYAKQTPFYNQFLHDFRWAPGMGLGAQYINNND